MLSAQIATLGAGMSLAAEPAGLPAGAVPASGPAGSPPTPPPEPTGPWPESAAAPLEPAAAPDQRRRATPPETTAGSRISGIKTRVVSARYRRPFRISSGVSTELISLVVEVHTV